MARSNGDFDEFPWSKDGRGASPRLAEASRRRGHGRRSGFTHVITLIETGQPRRHLRSDMPPRAPLRPRPPTVVSVARSLSTCPLRNAPLCARCAVIAVAAPGPLPATIVAPITPGVKTRHFWRLICPAPCVARRRGTGGHAPQGPAAARPAALSHWGTVPLWLSWL